RVRRSQRGVGVRRRLTSRRPAGPSRPTPAPPPDQEEPDMSLATVLPADTEEPRDFRDPEVRLAALLDPGTLGPLPAGTGASRPVNGSSGVMSARGTIGGSPVIAFATDATRLGGAMGSAGCRNIVAAIDTAVRERVPVIGLWHSGGARLAEGVE